MKKLDIISTNIRVDSLSWLYSLLTVMILDLDELDNSDNVKDGRPSNELLSYHVTSNEDFTSCEPCSAQYKKLKNDTITSLMLKITDHSGNIITDGLQVTVVLHIIEHKI